MNQALQTIQEAAGPDQRVTARAELYRRGAGDPDPVPATNTHLGRIQGKNIGRQYYTGVWDSTNNQIDPIKWLISSQPPNGATKNLFTHPQNLHQRNYPDSTDIQADPDFVKLVGSSGKVLQNALKQPIDDQPIDDSVRIWKSAVKEGQRGTDPLAYRNTGHFAWWAGDEELRQVNLGFGKIEEWVNKPAPTTEFEFKRPTPFTAAFNYGFKGFQV